MQVVCAASWSCPLCRGLHPGPVARSMRTRRAQRELGALEQHAARAAEGSALLPLPLELMSLVAARLSSPYDLEAHLALVKASGGDDLTPLTGLRGLHMVLVDTPPRCAVVGQTEQASVCDS